MANSEAEPMLGDAIPEVIEKTRQLLDWMPVCSKGSSGYQNRVAVQEALHNLEIAYALACL